MKKSQPQYHSDDPGSRTRTLIVAALFSLMLALLLRSLAEDRRADERSLLRASSRLSGTIQLRLEREAASILAFAVAQMNPGTRVIEGRFRPGQRIPADSLKLLLRNQPEHFRVNRAPIARSVDSAFVTVGLVNRHIFRTAREVFPGDYDLELGFLLGSSDRRATYWRGRLAQAEGYEVLACFDSAIANSGHIIAMHDTIAGKIYLRVRGSLTERQYWAELLGVIAALAGGISAMLLVLVDIDEVGLRRRMRLRRLVAATGFILLAGSFVVAEVCSRGDDERARQEVIAVHLDGQLEALRSWLWLEETTEHVVAAWLAHDQDRSTRDGVRRLNSWLLYCVTTIGNIAERAGLESSGRPRREILARLERQNGWRGDLARLYSRALAIADSAGVDTGVPIGEMREQRLRWLDDSFSGMSEFRASLPRRLADGRTRHECLDLVYVGSQLVGMALLVLPALVPVRDKRAPAIRGSGKRLG
ncbi:MAG: hypothetical protein AAB011_04310 [Candidatus Eisenbacteria bacterium]